MLALLLLPALAAADWPQWRGPDLNGTSPARNLPLRWTAQENVAWKLPLPGPSGSTPIVSGERVFLSVAEGDDLFLWTVDRRRGVLLWKRRLGGGNEKRRKHDMSSPSPTSRAVSCGRGTCRRSTGASA